MCEIGWQFFVILARKSYERVFWVRWEGFGQLSNFSPRLLMFFLCFVCVKKWYLWIIFETCRGFNSEIRLLVGGLTKFLLRGYYEYTDQLNKRLKSCVLFWDEIGGGRECVHLQPVVQKNGDHVHGVVSLGYNVPGDILIIPYNLPFGLLLRHFRRSFCDFWMRRLTRLFLILISL